MSRFVLPVLSRSAPRLSHAACTQAVDPRLLAMLRAATGCGLAVLACLPAARGSHLWLGWGPLWLVLMPATAWLLLAWRARGTANVPRARRRRQALPVHARAGRGMRRGNGARPLRVQHH